MSPFDSADLYDHEVKKVGEIWTQLTQKWSRRANTQANLAELAKEAEHKFLAAGFVIHVDLMPTIQVGTNGKAGAPVIEIMRRIADAPELKVGLDHEKKKYEVLDANKKGEEFRGQKEKAS